MSPLGGSVPRNLHGRFWIEATLGSAAGFLALTTLLRRSWIETLIGVDPDKGNGSAEWLVVVTLMIITVTLLACACLEWRRALVAERLWMYLRCAVTSGGWFRAVALAAAQDQ